MSVLHNPITAYRADVDALRAVSVLAVFLFHLDISLFSGGFVGVDVFYVISGYVIFRIVLQDIAERRFSLSAFWRRRVCRIVPALLLTIVACTAMGWWLMTPAEYAEFGYSALAALFSVSNFYFDDRLSYFGDNARDVPLVHTWSLGVEEQFYLLAPLLVLWLVRSRSVDRLPLALATVASLSFAYGLYALYGRADENHAFYLPMSRFWEIAVGGLVACWERRRKNALPYAEPLAWLGLVGVVASTVLIDTNTPFPGATALLPVGAAALFLATGLTSGSRGALLFRARPVVFLGRISYSTYLFHWPAITFTVLATGEPLNTGNRIIVLIGTIAFAAISWRFLENPFREAQRRPDVRPVRVLLGAAFALAAMVTTLPLTSGFPGRMTPEASAVLATLQALDGSAAPACESVERFGKVAKVGACSSRPDAERFDYILWGDSHAGMLQPELSGLLDPLGKAGLLLTLPDCPALIGVHTSKRKNRAECHALQDHVEGLVENERIPVVVLGGRWANLASEVRSPGDGGVAKTIYDSEADGRQITLVDALERTVRRLQTAGANVVIVGPVPEIGFSVPAMMVRAAHLGHAVPTNSRASFDERQASVLPALARLEGLPGVYVVYPHGLLCDAVECRVSDGFAPLYKDDDHLSLAGSKLVVPSIAAAVRAASQPKSAYSPHGADG